MRRQPGKLGGLLCWKLARFAGACLLTLGLLQASAQSTPPVANEGQQPFRLKVGSDLVVVRVVVRDAKGKPVPGLQKEDFKVLDRGKEQSISQFEAESAASVPSNTDAIPATGPRATPSAKESPNRFLALYVDTLNTTDQDMVYLRKAADQFLAANLHAQDRVAIFTSEKMVVDFTNDAQQIHAALASLKASARALQRVHECPDISDYQAFQIMQQENPEYSDAWQIAMDEAVSCGILAPSTSPSESSLTGEKASTGPPPPPSGDSSLASIVRSMARNVASQSELQTRTNLQGLERTVDYIAQMPGQRTVVLVSPGFLSESEKYRLDRVIDRALRSQVVLSALDPRGLAMLLREADASQKWIFGKPGTADRLDAQRELAAQSVLAEVANETGGTFFHNSNDLQAGFDALAGSRVDYVLAFAPSDLKDDGKFHSLKVKLADRHEAYSIQARSGYFAPRSATEAAAEAKQQAAFDAEAKEQEQLRDAMFSKDMSQQLQVGLGGKLSDSQGGMRELSLIAHLNARSLRFEKQGEHNVNTVTFVLAVFDPQDNLVTAQLRKAALSVPDAQLENVKKNGISVNMRFQLKPGTYRLREVVTDSEDHHLTAVSSALKVP
jgi:VWFA-related protein